ncbi:MAG: type II toxin-antitoxin system RelE/ParE family toxin [Gemmataceae bacterium]
MRVVIRPAAEADLAEVIGWYESNSLGLSFDLRLALLATLDQIARYPDSSTQVSPTVRRALLRRFPHAVYYRRGGDMIEVIAILHTHRSPRRWQQRQ